MKKYLVFIIALLLLTGTAAGIYSASVLETADKVEFTETVFYGDPAAAEGLHITFSNEQREEGYYLPMNWRRYLWTTEFVFKNGGFSANTLQGYKYGNPERENPESIRITDGYNSGRKYYLINEDLVRKIREENADEIGKNGSVTKRVPAKDVYEWFPLKFTLLRRSVGSSQSEYSYSDLDLAFDRYFRFPVDEDLYLDLRLGKNDGDLTVSADFSDKFFPYGKPGLYTSLSYGGDLYFSFEFRSEAAGVGKRRDYSLVPGGYGIYRIGLLGEDGQDKIDPESLTTFYSFGDDVTVKELRASENGRVINAFTSEGEEYVLYSIDAADGSLLQRLPVCGIGKRNSVFVQQNGDCMAMGAMSVLSDSPAELFIFKEDEQGVPRLELEADLGLIAGNRRAAELLSFGLESSGSYRNYGKFHDFIYLYEGDKLYFMSLDVSEESLDPMDYIYHGQCGISVVVYDKEGPLFFGSYESSIGDTVCWYSDSYPPSMWTE